MRLQGKNAIVTGAGSGIGYAIAWRFAQEGANVGIDYYGYGDQAQELVKKIQGQGLKAVAVEADVSRSDDVQKLVQTCVSQLGPLDIFVNNAGIEHATPFLELSESQWEKVLAVNLKGPFLCSQAAAKEMIKRKQGAIINISSIHEDIVFLNHADYAASKGGLRMLMRNIAVELAPHNIRVNNICPGAIETPINKATLESGNLMKELLAEIPLDRLGKPDDIADLAVYLASDAAQYVTGASIRIDGAMSIKAGGL